MEKERDKVTLNDLAQAIAKQAGMKVGQVRPFLASFGTLLADNIVHDGQVKVSGLGTFKLVQVEPRKSVDVNTGEAILIDGYTKVSFVPEPSVKARFASTSEATEPSPTSKPSPASAPANDPIAKLGQQADEIMGMVAEINRMEPVAPKATEAPVASQKPEATVAPVIPEEPVTPEVPVQKKDFSWLKAALTIVAIFLFLFIIIWFVLMHKIDQWMDRYFQDKKQPAKTEVVEEAPSQDAVVTDTVLVSETSAATAPEETAAPEKPATPEEAAADPTAPRTYDHFKASGIVYPGNGTLKKQLESFSSKFYGSHYFWVYIYEANRDLFLGSVTEAPQKAVKVRIPKMDKQVTDLYNKEALKTAKELDKQYTSGTDKK